MHRYRLGVDFGGVIISPVEDQEDTGFFSANYLDTPPFEGAFETLGNLTLSGFRDNIWIISKASRVDVQRKTKHWLEHRDFFNETGIARENLIFTAKRAGKLAVAENLEITHFVDDTLDVLENMHGKIPNLYYLKSQPGSELIVPTGITHVPSWASLENRITQTLK